MKSICQDPSTRFRTQSVHTDCLQGTGIPGHMHCSSGAGQPRTRASLGKHLAPNAPKTGGHPSVSGGPVRAPLHKHITLKISHPQGTRTDALPAGLDSMFFIVSGELVHVNMQQDVCQGQYVEGTKCPCPQALSLRRLCR